MDRIELKEGMTVEEWKKSINDREEDKEKCGMIGLELIEHQKKSLKDRELRWNNVNW